MDRSQHGGPYDRGSADAYYGRPRDPHWWPQGTYHGERVEARDMTQAELDAYELGYREQEASGEVKDWG